MTAVRPDVAVPWPQPGESPEDALPLRRTAQDSAASVLLAAPSPANRPLCALTIDLEEWFHGLDLSPDRWVGLDRRAVATTEQLLDLLAAHGARATFFVLGRVAEEHPELVQRILAAGHEIGSHGYAHQFIYRQSADEFDADLDRSLTALHRAGAPTITSYRAPYFSITNRSLWALDHLRSAGITLDSSIMPAPNPRYGIATAPLGPHWINAAGRPLLELPVSCIELAWLPARQPTRVPFGGGFYLRFFPLLVTRTAIRQTLRGGRPVVLYVHPWELDPLQPRLKLPARVAATRYYRLASTLRKLTVLLREYRWTTLSDVAASWQPLSDESSEPRVVLRG